MKGGSEVGMKVERRMELLNGGRMERLNGGTVEGGGERKG